MPACLIKSNFYSLIYSSLRQSNTNSFTLTKAIKTILTKCNMPLKKFWFIKVLRCQNRGIGTMPLTLKLKHSYLSDDQVIDQLKWLIEQMNKQLMKSYDNNQQSCSTLGRVGRRGNFRLILLIQRSKTWCVTKLNDRQTQKVGPLWSYYSTTLIGKKE